MLLRRERAMTGIAIMLDVAFHASRTETVNAADIADRLGQARRGIEPVLQALSRAGLLVSVRGPRGGYRLGRPGRDIPLGEVIAAALAEDLLAEAEMLVGGQLHNVVVKPLWMEMEQLCRDHLSQISLADLVKRATAAGVRRQALEPLNFVI
jgi:Rrf2 family protein